MLETYPVFIIDYQMTSLAEFQVFFPTSLARLGNIDMTAPIATHPFLT